MSKPSTPTPTPPAPAGLVPLHWTPEQALAVFECLQAMRQALWVVYGDQVQQAWRDQLMPDTEAPEFDPDDPFVSFRQGGMNWADEVATVRFRFDRSPRDAGDDRCALDR